MENYMACELYFTKAIKNHELLLDKPVNNFEDKRLYYQYTT